MMDPQSYGQNNFALQNFLSSMSVHQVSCNNCLNDERICKILAEDQNIIDIITEFTECR